VESHDAAHEQTAADVLSALTCRKIEEGLRAALRLVRGGSAAELDGLRALVDELRDRIAAWELTRFLRSGPPPGGRESRLAAGALSTEGGEPVREFLLIPFGEVGVEQAASGGGFVFTRRHAESARNWFVRLGRKLAIDYEHQSLDRRNTRPDGLRPAAGWIGGLEVREDGLWAVDVTWTPRARELLRSGEYRYFSPVIYWSDEDFSDVVALGPVALTNDPAMHGVRPLAASRAVQEAVESGQVAGPAADANPREDPAPGAECEAAHLPAEGAEGVLRAELEVARAEVALLRRRLLEQEAEAFVAAGLRAGKITEGSRPDWREDFLRDPRLARQRLARAPVVLPPGRLVAVEARSGVARPMVVSRRPEPEGGWGIEAEDLAAYERAVAAGRVRHAGWNGAGA
jgi:hypothetical protein